MNTSEFAQQYEALADDEVLCLWAERGDLVPEAEFALESEVQKRGLKKENAARVKRRRDALAAREGNLPQLVTAAKYERSMRHFVGWEEPEFNSPYGSRDIRGTFSYCRHKYRVWKSFRDHTGVWPVLSIAYYIASWLSGLALAKFLLNLSVKNNVRFDLVFVGGLAAFWITQRLGAKLMRRLDWKFSGNSNPR